MNPDNKDSAESPSGAERRAYERYPVNLAAEVSSQGAGARTCSVRDFCIGGMLLAYDASADKSNVTHLCTPVKDDTVTIKCSVPHDGKANELSFQAQVVRNEGEGFAVRFINPDLMALQLFQTYAKSEQNLSSIKAAHKRQPENLSTGSYNGKTALELIQYCDNKVEAAAVNIINRFLTDVADYLFELSKDSRDISEQNACFDALKVINANKDSVKESFLKAVKKKIAGYSPDVPMGSSTIEDTSDSSLSIVEDEVFDDWLADTSTIDSVETKFKDVLSQIGLRLSVLFDTKIRKENNPYGPVLFSHDLNDVLRPLGMRHSMNLACHKVFRNVLLALLGNIYDEINTYLRDNDVLREIKFKTAKPVSVDPAEKEEPPADKNLKEKAEQKAEKESVKELASNKSDLYQLVGELRSLQKQLNGQIGKEAVDNFLSGRKSSGSADSAAEGDQKLVDIPAQFSQTEVLDALSLIKSSKPGNVKARDYKEEVMRVLGKRSTDGEKVIGVRESQIMDVASNIFHSISEDMQVSEKVREWIDQLELPVLKIAMTDDSLFTDKSHTVREVINKIAQLEVLAEASGHSGQSAVTNAIKWIIDLVNEEFDGSTEVFARAVKQLDVLLNVQDRTYTQNLKKLIEEVEKEDALIEANPDQDAGIGWDDIDADERTRLIRRVHRLNEGDWTLFDAKSDNPKRSRIAWIAPRTERVVFANVLGEKDKVLRSIELARELHEGTARVLENVDEPVMDRAQYSMLQDLHQQLLHQSTHDQLTGLMSRREFENSLSEALADSRNNKSRHAVCFIDIDQFNVVNNACGYEGGDRLLQEISAQMREQLGEQGVLARIGSDEFGLLLKDCVLDDALEFAEDQLDWVRDYRLQWEDSRMSVGFSIGIVPLSHRSESVSSLIQAAESSCGIAKEMGGNRIQVFNASNEGLSRRRNAMKLAPEVDRIIDEETMYLRCQRIMPIGSDDTMKDHYEILLGVKDSNGNDVVTPEFIEAAEELKRMPDVDRWVIKTAFAWIVENEEVTSDIEMFSINLSGRSLNDEHFMDYIIEQIEKSRVPVDKICFEVTETIGVNNLSDASEFIETVKETGCKFSLDDFGTGMSSYAYLKNLPVDYLKIDGVFVKDMENNANDYAVVKSICEIGHFMGKKVIAEFVENNQILKMLRDIGVDYGQGYGIQKPRLLSDLN
ncbi:DUF1631 family protein [Kaarinaea lacus]